MSDMMHKKMKGQRPSTSGLWAKGGLSQRPNDAWSDLPFHAGNVEGKLNESSE